MSVSIADFWRLAIESRLLASADCQQLEGSFAGVKGAASQSNAATLGEWLIAGGVLSRYHVKTLLAGHAGPFFYGDYYVYDRIRSKEGRLAGLLRAVHLPTRHPVMLYFISGVAAEDPQWWAVAVQQIAWACSVGHPFASQCYQLLDLGQHKVVALEDLLSETAARETAAGADRAPGAADSTLAARFTDGARLAPADACRLAYQAGLGLARLHQLGQVHGSVRPENIWLRADGTAKLLQTPLAPEPAMGPAALDWTAAELPDGVANGKMLMAADYAAPELAQLGRPPDMLSDVYALGATLYQMLSGRPLFPGGDVASKLSRHVSQWPPPLESFGVPRPLAELIGYLLAKDPAGRYPTAAQAAEALAYFVDPAAVSYVPRPLATAAAFDQWLEGQPRVPGIAPGAIPTASNLAAYALAQYAAAQEAAGQNVPQNTALQNTASQYVAESAAPQEYLAPAATQAPFQQETAEPSSSFFDSIQPDAPSFGPSEIPESAPAAEVAASSAGSTGLDLDAILDATPHSARSKTRRPASSAPKATLSPILLAGLGLGLAAVLVIVGVFVAKAINGGGSPDDGTRVAYETPEGGTSSTGNGANDPSKTSSDTTDPAQGNPKAPPIESRPNGSTPNDSRLPKAPAAGGSGSDKIPVQTVADDGVSLWASPTAGNPLPLDYVASGAQLILAVRPANIVRRPEGDQLLPSLGPWGDMAAHALKDATGLDLNQIDQVLLVVHDSGDGHPVSTAIIRTLDKIAADERMPAWGKPTATTDGNATYYQGPKLAYYLPAKEGGKLLVIGPAAQIKEIVHPADGPPAMARALELILPQTDAERDVTLAFVPSYMSGDGQSILSGPLLALRKALDDFFGSDVSAAQFSLHFQVNLFLELRTLGSPDKDARTVCDDLVRRVKAIPTGVENDLDALNLHPYDRKLLRRLPEWMRLMTEYTRSGVEDDQPVLRCYLPSVAGPNLLLGMELALEEQPVQGGGVVAADGPKKPQTVAELLKKKTTLTFPRDTLEKALQMLFDDIGVKHQILGSDLQLEGITKNQSFGLDEHDKPAEEILRKIMRLANPDGKLVYVIKPQAPGGPEMLFITTRAAAAKRGDKLPPGLDAGPAKSTPTKKKS
jgi:serine/threonine-protein kinase